VQKSIGCGRPHDAMTIEVIVEPADAERVSCEQQRSFERIPDDDAEVALQAAETVAAPAPVARCNQRDIRSVGVCESERRGEIDSVIESTVEAHHGPAV